MTVKKHILVMDAVEQYRRYYDTWAVLQQAGLLSAVNVPIVVNDAAIGIINLMSIQVSLAMPLQLNGGRAD